MKNYLSILALFLLFFSGCKNSYEKILKSKDFVFKLQKADEYYDRKQYTKANALYEELLTVYKGTKNFETIYYKYAFSFYYDQNYLAASYHFKNFADLFPKSPKAEECEYLNSLCLNKLSPEYSLDQTNTIKSIGELQTFVNTHPESKRVKDANKLIDESRAKLEIKDQSAAELYYKIGEYKAAVVAFEQILRKYPDSKIADYFQYMIVKSDLRYAKYSITEKQEERYNRTLADCADFIRKYPKSQYKSEVEKINALSSQSLKKITKS